MRSPRRQRQSGSRPATLAAGFLSLAAGCAAVALVTNGSSVRAAGPPPPPPPPPVPPALQGLTAQQMNDYNTGFGTFTHQATVAEGLGPVFNGRSCVECHRQPIAGGASPDLTVSRVTRIGKVTNGAFDPLTNEGGSLLQARSIKELLPACPITGEVVPADATIVSHRTTLPLFGDGLIEAIPDGAILAQAQAQASGPDGLHGMPNLVVNPETGKQEIGRFGWKGHVPTLHLFSGDALLNEIGITNPTFSSENLPQGKPIPPQWQQAPALQDNGTGVSRLTNFMRYLAPPPRGGSNPQVQAGAQVFNRVGCAACHTPNMNTGPNAVVALSNKPVPLFSDLLIHDMGPQLADGVVMGSADGRHWRTTPLWGLGGRKFFLHDGRTTDVMQSVLMHGGESANSVQRMKSLNTTDQAALAAFLKSL